MTRDADTCDLKSIARNAACRIFTCDYGLIHVNVGFATLRLTPAALRLVGQAIDEACAALRDSDETRCVH
jgi:hypothetical protein